MCRWVRAGPGPVCAQTGPGPAHYAPHCPSPSPASLPQLVTGDSQDHEEQECRRIKQPFVLAHRCPPPPQMLRKLRITRLTRWPECRRLRRLSSRSTSWKAATSAAQLQCGMQKSAPNRPKTARSAPKQRHVHTIKVMSCPNQGRLGNLTDYFAVMQTFRDIGNYAPQSGAISAMRPFAILQSCGCCAHSARIMPIGPATNRQPQTATPGVYSAAIGNKPC